MAKKPEPVDALDAETFDLDAWIDEVVRPTVTVELYPREAEFTAKADALLARIVAAEKVKPDDRSVSDDSPEALNAEFEELKAQRSREALRVQVQQVTNAELAESADAFKARTETDPDDQTLWIVAAACVKPDFTPAQLARLRARDRSGENMVMQLTAAVAELQRGLPVPSSPAPSDGSQA